MAHLVGFSCLAKVYGEYSARTKFCSPAQEDMCDWMNGAATEEEDEYENPRDKWMLSVDVRSFSLFLPLCVAPASHLRG